MTKTVPLKGTDDMIEESDPPDYMNEQVFQRNRLQPRAYSLPAETQCLSGKWRFHYASSPLEPEPTSEEPESWSFIDVPGMQAVPQVITCND